MTFDEFLVLEYSLQKKVTWENGTSIAHCSGSGQGFELYHLYNFYVEVVVCFKEKRMVDLVPFKDGSKLDKYLLNVKI